MSVATHPFGVVPKIIHSIHFQWDENQYVDPAGTAFDMTPHYNMCAYAPDFDVKLWTYPLSREFCIQHYPAIWETLEKCSRPVMMIDVLRWLVISHFGGIYWQMRTTPLVPMQDFLPTANKSVRLFTENVMTAAQCQAMSTEPIRAGKPEEAIRISNQVFSAEPGSPYVQKTISFLLNRIQTLTPQKDYDVLYISANAAVSEAYDSFGRDDSLVELTDFKQTRRMIKWRYGGSWRKDKVNTAPPQAAKPPSRPKMDYALGLASLYYTWIKRHPHEVMLTQRDVSNPRSSFLSVLAPVIDQLDIKKVSEVPSGIFANNCPAYLYMGGDPNRLVVCANRQRCNAPKRKFRQVVPLYARYAKVDLFICGDFLEYLSFSEGIRVLRRILKTARPKYLALTDYPLLLDYWDTALGDFRPINFQQKPYAFPEPVERIALPPQDARRPDRSLAIWAVKSLPPLG